MITTQHSRETPKAIVTEGKDDWFHKWLWEESSDDDDIMDHMEQFRQWSEKLAREEHEFEEHRARLDAECKRLGVFE